MVQHNLKYLPAVTLFQAERKVSYFEKKSHKNTYYDLSKKKKKKKKKKKETVP